MTGCSGHGLFDRPSPRNPVKWLSVGNDAWHHCSPAPTDTTPAISGDFYSSRVSWARVGGWHAVQKVWNLLIVQEIVQEMSFSSRTFSICAFHGRMCHMWLLGKLTLLFRFAFAEKRIKCLITVQTQYDVITTAYKEALCLMYWRHILCFRFAYVMY